MWRYRVNICVLKDVEDFSCQLLRSPDSWTYRTWGNISGRYSLAVASLAKGEFFIYHLLRLVFYSLNNYPSKGGYRVWVGVQYRITTQVNHWSPIIASLNLTFINFRLYQGLEWIASNIKTRWLVKRDYDILKQRPKHWASILYLW